MNWVAVVYVIPIGMIQAITNRQVGLKYAGPLLTAASLLTDELLVDSVITELIIGFMLPGRISIQTSQSPVADQFRLGRPNAMMMCVFGKDGLMLGGG